MEIPCQRLYTTKYDPAIHMNGTLSEISASLSESHETVAKIPLSVVRLDFRQRACLRNNAVVGSTHTSIVHNARTYFPHRCETSSLKH